MSIGINTSDDCKGLYEKPLHTYVVYGIADLSQGQYLHVVQHWTAEKAARLVLQRQKHDYRVISTSLLNTGAVPQILHREYLGKK